MTARSMTTAPASTAPSKEMEPTAPQQGARAAADRAVSKSSTSVRIGGLQFDLPPRDQLAFLAGLGALAALELIEWPIALAIGVGHELARNHHSKVLRDFGEALEEA